MIRKKVWLAIMLVGLLPPLATDAGSNRLKRMYVLDCGRLIAKDQSRWTPGINVGQPREFSNNCYLFQHERGTLLWETGVPDSVTEHKNGITAPSGAIVWFRDRTLKDQLESLGMSSDDITYVAISHAHGDQPSAFAELIRGHFAGAIAAWKAAHETRKVCEELSGLNDRMLSDIGLTPDEIVRLRSGDRFIPARYVID